MNKKLKNSLGGVAVMSMAFFGMNILTACNPEPDESDIYTSQIETAEDYISRKSSLASFNQILQRVGLDRRLSSYGEYTCFVPTNEAIALYIDSLWNDSVAVIPHNGLTDNSLHGLIDPNSAYSDSLCNDIALYHLANSVYTSVEMGSGSTVRTMLGRKVNTELSAANYGRVALEKTAILIECDSLVSNGIVHVLNRVIPRSNRVIADELDRHSDYSIFMEALKLTGLVDSLTLARKNVDYTIDDNTDTNGSRLYSPTECEVKYTIFAEPDVILKEELRRRNYSQDINGLIEFAKDAYGNAADWYDYINEKGLTVSTGTDYTNRFNTLNMFVAYHILYAGMPQNELVFEYSARWINNWNYVNGGEPYDYYETMLPNTIMKIWQPQPGNVLYINRARQNNTLTDELASMGSEGMHQIITAGVRIARTTDANRDFDTNIQAYNGYIHGIRGMLVYDEKVPKYVLHERMRFDATTIIPEFINNGIRMSNSSEISALNGGGSGARVAFPLNYFNNVVSYTDQNKFRYNVKGAYNAWQGDTFQGWGNYDLAIKMPPLPTGTYEFRVFYTPMGHGGMMMFYMGDSKSLTSMMALDIPLDVRIPIDDPRIGWTNFNEEEDLGVATDAAMRNRGYMRGLFSYMDHPENHDGNATDRNQRYTKTGNNSLRKILGRMDIKQSGEKWFRIKNVIPDETDLKWQFDYIEFVPIDVVDNEMYSEDWY